MLGKNTDRKRTNRFDLTKVSIACVCLLLVFALALSASGCSKGGLPGKNAPEYKSILDWEYAMDTFGPDAYKDMMGREGEKILKTVTDVLGYDNLKQTELQATKAKDMVSVRSYLKYKGGKKDNSFIGAMTAWQPAKPGMIKGFQPDGLLGLFAIGNPTQLIDLMAEWAIESGQIEDFIDELPDGERAEIKMTYKIIRMTAKGYLSEARDEYFPLFGDEIVVAVYVNDDFVGWDDQWEAEGFEEASPVHVIAAIELSKPGLAEMIEDLIDENMELLSQISGPSYSFDEFGEYVYEEPEFKIHTKKVDGVKISYFEIEEDFSVAWAEIKNIFFIGNLEAIENLGDFYRPGKSQFAMASPYCEYVFINADEIVDSLVPDEAFDELEDSLDMMKDYGGDEDLVEMMEDMADILLDSDDFGIFQVVMQTRGGGFETTLSCGTPIADLIMIGLEFAEYSLEEGL